MSPRAVSPCGGEVLSDTNGSSGVTADRRVHVCMVRRDEGVTLDAQVCAVVPGEL